MMVMWQQSHQSIGNLHGGQLLEVSHDEPQEQQEDGEDAVVDEYVAVEEEDGEDWGEGSEAVVVEDIDDTGATAEEGGESEDRHVPQGQRDPLDEGLSVKEVVGPGHEVGLSADLADDHKGADHAHQVKLATCQPDLHDEQELAGGLERALQVGDMHGELLHLRGVDEDGEDLDTEEEEAEADCRVEKDSREAGDQVEAEDREAENETKEKADGVRPLGQLVYLPG